MKKILKYTFLAALALSVCACAKKELDTNPFGEGVRLAAMAPNPVMRGGELRILGSNLDQVSEVRFTGEVSVTDFEVVTSGVTGELRVIVPLEGPLVGPVSLVGKDGTVHKSFSDLTFTEPVEIDSYSPASVLSGDVITFKGEYLDVVREVIFTGDENAVETTFLSQSRHELKVAVPSSAISGPIILSDVNELEDDSTIPNHVYTKTDLTVEDPTVETAAKATYKLGDEILVKGEHLDMIKRIDLPQASDVEFILSGDCKTISFELPATATDGNITLTSFGGATFDGGEIETVSVSGLSIKTLAQDGRYKAGCMVEISGEDLDLVTDVAFVNAELVDWEYDEETGKITVELPADARDGAVTLTLDSGKTAETAAIEVVKPVILAWTSLPTYVAGETVITVEGTDLDLVDTVLMGDEKQGFFECANDYDEEDDVVKVTIPEQAYTSPIVFISAADYTTETLALEVSYKMPLSITFDSPSYAMGKKLSFTGENLLKIESITVKGTKVTDYSLRQDDAVVFTLPENVGPGVYRLNMVLVDGTELTWPVPFEVTAPFTETFFWEGSEDLSGGAQPYLGADGALAGTLQVGDLIRVYFNTTGNGWWLEIFGGHWDGQLFKATSENTDPSVGYCVFEVTDANIGSLTSVGGWGGVLVVQGGSIIVTGASVIHFGAVGTTIWEGSVALDWSGKTEGAVGSMGALSWGGYDWSSVSAGTTLSLEFQRTADEVQIRLGNGNWAALPGTEDPYKPDGDKLEVELTADMITEMVSNGGLVITGQGYTLTAVILK
ncbi:MAG: hypothetical protein IKI85_07440 [Bacteroidales bacterium]|nr:hypothetical protein [Bacteroidales bacterium]